MYVAPKIPAVEDTVEEDAPIAVISSNAPFLHVRSKGYQALHVQKNSLHRQSIITRVVQCVVIAVLNSQST